MFIRTHIVSGLLLALAASGFAQGKPDFSGEWTLNRQASTLSSAAAGIRSGDVRIEHRDPTFRYKAVLKARPIWCSTNSSFRQTVAKSPARSRAWRPRPAFDGKERRSYSVREFSAPVER